MATEIFRSYGQEFGHNEYVIGKCHNCKLAVLAHFSGRALKRYACCPNCGCTLISGIPGESEFRLTEIIYEDSNPPPDDVLKKFDVISSP